MVAFSQTPWSRYRVRSISLPARSHPSTIRVEQELAKLRSMDSSSFSTIEAICNSLSGLVDLYRSINEVLNLPLAQQALATHRCENWIQELVDGSVRFLDICDNTRDAILVIKQSIRELQSAIRRNKHEDSIVENSIATYICSRKRIKHEIVKKSLASLREMDYNNTAGAGAGFCPLGLENEVTAAVIRVMREASSVTCFVFNSVLLSFLAMPMMPRPKPRRWTFVSRLVQRGAIGQRNKELENLDEVHLEATVGERLEGLDLRIEGIESGMEGLFRELIQTRVCFLNIISE